MVAVWQQQTLADAPRRHSAVAWGRRWRATPLRVREWTKWFDQQLSASSKTPDQGIYVGLRMDGRVRASGRRLGRLAPVLLFHAGVAGL